MKIDFFAIKITNIGISPGFWLIKEGNDVSNIYYKIQDHTCTQFFKILILNIGGCINPLPTSNFDSLKGGTPNFFVKMSVLGVLTIS